MWDLTDEERSDLMDAVQKVVEPYWTRVESSILFEGEPMTIYPVGIREDCPEGIRALAEVYDRIIEKGAIAVDPEYIETKEEG